MADMVEVLGWNQPYGEPGRYTPVLYQKKGPVGPITVAVDHTYMLRDDLDRYESACAAWLAAGGCAPGCEQGAQYEPAAFAVDLPYTVRGRSYTSESVTPGDLRYDGMGPAACAALRGGE